MSHKSVFCWSRSVGRDSWSEDGRGPDEDFCSRRSALSDNIYFCYIFERQSLVGRLKNGSKEEYAYFKHNFLISTLCYTLRLFDELVIVNSFHSIWIFILIEMNLYDYRDSLTGAHEIPHFESLNKHLVFMCESMNASIIWKNDVTKRISNKMLFVYCMIF